MVICLQNEYNVNGEKMELRNVKTFIKIAEIGNFSRAASDLGYAQSTVTMQIQTLERELGVSLFERNGKSAVLSGHREGIFGLCLQSATL